MLELAPPVTTCHAMCSVVTASASVADSVELVGNVMAANGLTDGRLPPRPSPAVPCLPVSSGPKSVCQVLWSDVCRMHLIVR